MFSFNFVNYVFYCYVFFILIVTHVLFCVLCFIVLLRVLFFLQMCAVLLPPGVNTVAVNTLRTGLLNCLNARSRGLTFRHRASCI